MKGVTVRLIKGKDGGIEKVVFDWEGYTGKTCDLRAEKLAELLRERGIEVEELNKEYKDEYYLSAEEEIQNEDSIEL